MDEYIRDMFAKYGRLIYTAQQIEKIVIALSIRATLITRSRYDELFYHRSQLPFGLLKKELEATNRFSSDEMKMIDNFNIIRNDLVHHFWWDRSVEFAIEEKRAGVLSDLEEVERKIDDINAMINYKAMQLAAEFKLDLEQIEEDMKSIGVTPVTESFRKLRSEETLVDIRRYKRVPGSSTPIFILDDNTYWSICESGLTQWKNPVDITELEEIEQLKGIFPVKQFNPKPNKLSDFHFDLLLKTRRLQISVRPAEREGLPTYSWSISTKPK